MRVLPAAVVVAVVLLAVSLLAAQEPLRAPAPVYKPTIDLSLPAIQAIAPAGDAVSRLMDRVGRGEVALGRDGEGGALAAVLAALDVPRESQVLVFSKTSVQAAQISPARPRAIYFS